MNKKQLQKIALEIASLEQKCQDGENVSENLDKMIEIGGKLSFEDLLFIDEYILTHHLTK